jgi:imidazole glycerol-phosphate synthase subunit HisH
VADDGTMPFFDLEGALMRVTIFDYGAGNLHSLAKAVRAPGVELSIESDPLAAIRADVLILPGVGAFSPAAARFSEALDPVRGAIQNGLRCLGICLGMQLLFEESDEGRGRGLGIFQGRVRRLKREPIPQIGWNTLEWSAYPSARLGEAYFANSFVCPATEGDSVAAWSEHNGDRFPAVIRQNNILGVQFHPEKSSVAGVGFLRSWIEGRLCW